MIGNPLPTRFFDSAAAAFEASADELAARNTAVQARQAFAEIANLERNHWYCFALPNPVEAGRPGSPLRDLIPVASGMVALGTSLTMNEWVLPNTPMMLYPLTPNTATQRRSPLITGNNRPGVVLSVYPETLASGAVTIVTPAEAKELVDAERVITPTYISDAIDRARAK